MEISFKSRRLSKEFSSDSFLVRRYGSTNTKVLALRLAAFGTAHSLQDLSNFGATNFHQLKGDRDEQFAVNLSGGKRLVFEVGHAEVPRKEDKGVELSKVTAVRIVEIVDYH